MNGTRRAGGAFAALSLMVLSGCGRYADFSLPPPAGPRADVAFRWEVLPDPVLARGAPGSWDSVDALNPSVVRRGPVYYNFYSGFDGQTWRTGLATSSDGLRWEKQGSVLSPDPGGWEGDSIAANGSALVTGSGFQYWYQAGRPPRIGQARSDDGRAWRKHPRPVLGTGPRGSWDERGVADPYVIEAGGTYYMYYLGQDRARRQRLGVARSRDGLAWEKLRTNPILELGDPGSFDENGLGEPAVWNSQGRYWMLYTGRDLADNRRIGLAWSGDGVRWTRASEAPVLSGTHGWNSKVVCDPAVIAGPDGVRVWFGGGDVARPDQGLHGQIGLAIARPVDANLSK
jgi:predicted GH43/DUF377 family glycosyl hydrolase